MKQPARPVAVGSGQNNGVGMSKTRVAVFILGGETDVALLRETSAGNHPPLRADTPLGNGAVSGLTGKYTHRGAGPLVPTGYSERRGGPR